jgi:hypothetical protein
MELVPFDEKWAGSETKLDLQAWYRRPSVHGGFSLVGPFPLRRHLDWTRKGYDYVTLATSEDVSKVLGALRVKGTCDIPSLAKSYDHMGHFKVADYLKDQRGKDDAFLVELQAKVDKFGVDAVTEMMRMNDPGFVMPEGVLVKKAVAKKETSR